MRTIAQVDFGLYDVTARGDSNPVSDAAQPFCNILTDLKLDEVPEQKKYGTLEKNQFLMDKTFSLFPDFPDEEPFWGLWSKVQSGEDGQFSEPPVLEITFTQPHSSAGITLHFYAPTQDFATGVTIKWYGDKLLRTARFTPDKVDYYCQCKVENYTKIVLTFTKVNRPGRYLKLSGIDYGVFMSFKGAEVVNANVLEEVDILSDEISINTLNLTLYNRNGDFSVLNENGVLDVLQHKQKFTVYEEVKKSGSQETVKYNIGTFYLSGWENTSDTLASFTATDAIGLLDSAPYDGGIYDTTVPAMVADVLNGYEYELDPAFENETVKGYLPVGTKRNALQQLAFAIGAIVDCSRSDKIKIYSPVPLKSSQITHDRKWQGGKITLLPLITGVSVTAHQYVPSDAEEKIFGDTLGQGTHKITFSEPATELAITGGKLVETSTNFAVVSVETDGEVTITGKKYVDYQTVTICEAENIPANVQDNVLEVKDATLVSQDRALSVANRILAYYANRYEHTFKMVAGDEQLSNTLIVDSFGGKQIRGVLNQMKIDLSGGFVVDAKVVGTSIGGSSSDVYTTEIRAPERSWL